MQMQLPECAAETNRHHGGLTTVALIARLLYLNAAIMPP